MKDVKAQVQAGLARAVSDGMRPDYQQLREFDGRSQPVSPGFDPWTADIELPSADDWTSTNFAEWGQIQAASTIKACEAEIKGGDGVLTLMAVDLAVKHGLVPPAWLADAFCERVRNFTHREVRGIDEAFGNKPLTERARKHKHEKGYLIPAVHMLVKGMVTADPKTKLGVPLYEAVGEYLGISKNTVEKLYNEGVQEGLPSAATLRKWARAKARSSEARTSVGFRRRK